MSQTPVVPRVCFLFGSVNSNQVALRPFERTSLTKGSDRGHVSTSAVSVGILYVKNTPRYHSIALPTGQLLNEAMHLV